MALTVLTDFRRGPSGKFIPPVLRQGEDDGGSAMMRRQCVDIAQGPEIMDENLRHIDPKMVERIKSEVRLQLSSTAVLKHPNNDPF